MLSLVVVSWLPLSCGPPVFLHNFPWRNAHRRVGQANVRVNDEPNHIIPRVCVCVCERYLHPCGNVLQRCCGAAVSCNRAHTTLTYAHTCVRFARAAASYTRQHARTHDLILRSPAAAAAALCLGTLGLARADINVRDIIPSTRAHTLYLHTLRNTRG